MYSKIPHIIEVVGFQKITIYIYLPAMKYRPYEWKHTYTIRNVLYNYTTYIVNLINKNNKNIFCCFLNKFYVY